MLTTSISDIGL